MAQTPMAHDVSSNEAGEPCIIWDGPPSGDLPIPPWRTRNVVEILAACSDEELARWPGPMAQAERERRRRQAQGRR